MSARSSSRTDSPFYFGGGMVRKHERGELHLERSVWALREAEVPALLAPAHHGLPA